MPSPSKSTASSAHRQQHYRLISTSYTPPPSKSATLLHFIIYFDTSQKTVSTYAPQFRSNISFCFEIRSNHDCLSELMPQTVFKPAFISRASGASNSHRALPCKHYKYLIPLFHLLLRRHPFNSIFLLSLSLSLLKNSSVPPPSRFQVKYPLWSQESHLFRRQGLVLL